MTELGRVVEVTAEEFGSVLTEDVPPFSTIILPVKSAVDFDEQGGTLSYPDPADESLTIEADYQYCDKDANTVALAIALPSPGLDRDTRINVVSSTPDRDYIAQVMIDDEDEPVSARVPHGLRDKLPEGVRDEDAQEAVEIAEDAGGEWYVSQVYGTDPIIDSPSIGIALVTDQIDTDTGAWTTVLWVDSPNRHFDAPKDGYLIIRRDGRYLIVGSVAFEGSGSGTARRGRLVLNNGGSDVILRETYLSSGGAEGGTRFQVVTSEYLTAGDRIRMDVWQNTGASTLDLLGDPDGHATALDVTYIAAV